MKFDYLPSLCCGLKRGETPLADFCLSEDKAICWSEGRACVFKMSFRQADRGGGEKERTERGEGGMSQLERREREREIVIDTFWEKQVDKTLRDPHTNTAKRTANKDI